MNGIALGYPVPLEDLPEKRPCAAFPQPVEFICVQ